MHLSWRQLLVLIAVFFFSSIISVVTGSTSLLTVPAMIAIGIEPHAAVATNMLALIFLSLGGSAQFVRRNVVHRKYLRSLLILTVVGSAIGATILLAVSARTLRIGVAGAMLCISGFMLWKRDIEQEAESPPPRVVLLGFLATFLLAVYGGFFSGGYVTLLTAAFIACFGMTFHQSVATTKVVNVFSSAIATGVFLWRGIVDVRLGLILGVTMFIGAIVGSHFALRLSAIWLRRVFVAAVFVLAVGLVVSSL